MAASLHSIWTEGDFSSSITRKAPSKRKVIGFAIVIILGLGGLALAGVGLGGYLRAGSHTSLGQVHSMIMMAAGGGGGIVFLIVAIVGCVKNCKRSSHQQKNNHASTEQITQQKPSFTDTLLEVENGNNGQPTKIEFDREPPLPPKGEPIPDHFTPVEDREEARARLLEPKRKETLTEVQLFLISENWVKKNNEEFDSIYRHLLLQGDLESIRCIFEKTKDGDGGKCLSNLTLDVHRGRIESPLFFATLGGNLEIVKMLVEKGADLVPDPYCQRWVYPVRTAVRYNVTQIASYLLEKGAKSDGIINESQTFLGFAAYHGMKEMVKLLIRHQASVHYALDINFEFFTKQKKSAKEFSIFRSSIKLLFDYGMGTDFSTERFNVLTTFSEPLDVSDFNFLGISIDGQQVTRAMLAQMGFRNTEHAYYTMTDVMKLTDTARRGQLMECYTDQVAQKGLGDNLIPLYVAAQKGDISTLTLRLEEGINADVNQKFYVEGETVTALYCAVQANQLEAISFLLKKGADPFIQCKGTTSTAALLAAKKGAFEILDLFDLSQHLEDSDQGSAHLIHYAVMHSNTYAIKSLIKQGANVNAKAAHSGFTPLYYALLSGKEENFHLLIELGADPLLEFGSPLNGTTNPLIFAVKQFARKRAQLSVLETLIPHYLKISNWYVEPLFTAVRYGNEEIFKWLHQKGACLDAVYKDQESLKDQMTLMDYIQSQELKRTRNKEDLKQLQGIKSYINSAKMTMPAISD